jgi:hypothetical protein
MAEGPGERQCMRRLTLAVTLAMAFVAASAVPAMADQPTTIIPEDPLVWEDTNPCSGMTHEVILNPVVSIHEHRNNGLFHVSYTGSTSSGYTLVAGTENAMRNTNVVRGTFNFQWQHPDGSKISEHGQFVINFQKDEMLVDVLSSRCNGSD